jgi:hypothetical protein
VRSADEVDQRRADLQAFLASQQRPVSAPRRKETRTMLQTQGVRLFDDEHTVIFHRTRGPIRMLRAEASAAVKADPLNVSFDPWSRLQDVGAAVEIPANWRDLPEREQRKLMSALRLPPGARGEPNESNIVTIAECLSHRFRVRWAAAMGVGG